MDERTKTIKGSGKQEQIKPFWYTCKARYSLQKNSRSNPKLFTGGKLIKVLFHVLFSRLKSTYTLNIHRSAKSRCAKKSEQTFKDTKTIHFA